MRIRLVIAGLLGGVAMFAWSAVSTLVLPLGELGVQSLPNEAAAIADMHGALGDGGGLYVFPTADAHRQMPKGPSGFLVFHGPSYDMSMTPTKLGLELLSEIFQSALAAILLSATALTAYVARAAFVAGVGVAVAVGTNASFWIWYGFPNTYAFGNGAMQAIGYLLAGLVIAAVLRRRDGRFQTATA